MTMEFNPLDVLRLEVRESWPDLPNVVENPSGEGGAWGWQGSSASLNPAYIFEIRSNPTRYRFGVDPAPHPPHPTRSDYSVESSLFSIPKVTAAGATQVRGRVQLVATSPAVGDIAEMQVWAYDANGTGTLLAIVAMPAVPGTYSIPATNLPVGTVAVTVRFAIQAQSSTVAWREFNAVTLVVGTPTEVAAASMTAEPPWVNITGPTSEISTERDELNVGMLNATVYDATLDPAADDLIRPGKPCRLRALVNGAWQRLFTGTLGDPSTVYQLRDPNLPDLKRTRIQIVATDPATPLANAPRPDGVATIPELPYVLLGTGVPWMVNGSTEPIDPAQVIVVARNDQASALDQVAITRDSALGFAWVDRTGMLQVWDAAELPTTLGVALDEDDYSDLNVDFDLQRCINSVVMKLLRINPGTGETEDVTLGPYENSDSIREWGRRRAEFTVQGLTETEVAAHAAAILAANANPQQRINALTLPLRTVAELNAKALLDLYDLIPVSNTRAAIAENLRVTSVKHRISTANGGRWFVDLGFTVEGSVAMPQVTPSPVPSGGKTLAELLRPVGEVTMWYGAKADIPAGWLPLDGSAFDPNAYPKLAALLGTSVLPDMTDRFPIGAGTKALGTIGGSSTKTIAVANLPPHTHTVGASSGTGSSRSRFADGTANGTDPHDTGAGPGSSTPLDVMNPWRALWFVIRAA